MRSETAVCALLFSRAVAGFLERTGSANGTRGEFERWAFLTRSDKKADKGILRRGSTLERRSDSGYPLNLWKSLGINTKTNGRPLDRAGSGKNGQI